MRLVYLLLFNINYCPINYYLFRGLENHQNFLVDMRVYKDVTRYVFFLILDLIVSTVVFVYIRDNIQFEYQNSVVKEGLWSYYNLQKICRKKGQNNVLNINYETTFYTFVINNP